MSCRHRSRCARAGQVVVRGGLLNHLHALRDYALLAKGNFYSNFIQESREACHVAQQLARSSALSAITRAGTVVRVDNSITVS